MNTVLKWAIAIMGWLALLIMYAVWKDVEKHTGGGFVTGLLRGLIIFGSAFFLYNWAKNGSGQTKQQKDESPVAQVPTTLYHNLSANDLASTDMTSTTSSTSTFAQQLVVDEDRIYAHIAEELETGATDKGLWTRLFAECNGDLQQVKILYIKQRAERLFEAEKARIELEARERTTEAERKEELRLEGLSLREKLAPKNITKELTAQIGDLSRTNRALSLLNSVRLNQQNAVTVLLNHDPLLVAVSNSEGDTALHIALRERYVRIVQLLIESGARVDISNAYGVTPLELAEKSGLPELISLLSVVA